jgi:PAS domain S-box-containing protein
VGHDALALGVPEHGPKSSACSLDILFAVLAVGRPGEVSMHESPRIRLVAYGVAVLAPAATLLVKWPLSPVQGDRVLYGAFFPAVLIAAYLGGLWPGLLATLFSALAATYFLVDPPLSLAITTVHDAVALSIFVLVGAVISGLSEALHRTRRRLVAEERRRAEEALSESEERFRFLVQNSWDIISLFDADGTILYQAPSIERLLGHRSQDRIGRNVFRDPLVHPDDMAAKRAFFDAVWGRPGVPVTAQFRLRHADGSWRDIEAIGQNFLYAPGVARIVANYRDVTERKRAEEALRQREEHYRSVIAALREGIIVLDAHGRISASNVSAERILGLSAEEIRQRTPLDPRWRVIHEDGSPFPGETHPDVVALRTGQPCSDVVMGVRKPSGELIWIAVSSQPLFRTQERTPYAVVTSFSDITGRRRAEEELRLANARLELAVRGSNIGIWDVDMPDGDPRHGRVSYVNIWEQLGYECPDVPPDQETGMAPLHPDDRPLLEEAIRSYLAGETSKYEVESRSRHKDGSYRWSLARGVVVRDAGGKPIRFVGSSIDITDHKRAEESLRQSEERFRTLAKATNDAVWDWDLATNTVWCNEGFLTLFGYRLDNSETTPEWWLGQVHPGDRGAVEESIFAAIRGAEPTWAGEYRFRCADGSYKDVYDRGYVIRDAGGNATRMIGAMLDITARKRAEEALRESEERIRQLLSLMPAAVYTCDAEGRITFYNRRAAELWGREPRLGTDDAKFCGSLRLWQPDGSPLPHDRTPIAACIRDGRSTRNTEVIIERPDGARVVVSVNIDPLYNQKGGQAGAINVFEDVTDRKRAEQALRESEERFRGTFENAAVGIAHTHPSGRFLRVNEKFCTVVGYPREELLQRTYQDITHPDDLTASIEVSAAALRGESPGLPLEKRYLRKDGSLVWVELSASLQRNAAGNPDYLIAIVQDVSQRKRLEEALRESEERFRGTFENAAVGIAHADPEGRWLRFNEKFCAIVGHSREELLQRTYQDITHPDDLAASIDATAALFRGEFPNFGLEKRFVRKDGSPVWAQVFISLQRDAAGVPAYDIGIFHDITERKRLEEALRASEERYRFLIRSIPQKIFTANADGEVDYLNQQWTEFTGRSFDQLIGWGWTQIIHPEDVEENVRRSQHSIDTGEPFQVEHRVRRADGVYRWHLRRAVAMRDAEGRVLMWFGSNTDIDDQKQAAEAFKQAKEAAEAANRAKDEFLANVSHEIRTPMNAILGMTELALDTPLTDDQRQCLRTVKSAADNLLGLINDLLDFAKIESGKLELNSADFSLRAAVGDTLRALAARAHRKGLELACNVQQDVPDALLGDAARLRQVLLNLVGNAIKFTEHGEVVVRVEVAEPDGEVGLRFSVSDTGIGIPPDQQERIFRAFEQEDTSTTRRYGGTGLGLTISARLVALMGGTITVDSEPSRGSTFAFTARFGRQPHPPEQPPARLPGLLRGLRVLVVDDNPTNRHILGEWLTGWRMEPVAVGDGMAALGALWDAVSAGRPYPLVLLDARMPDTDGLALAARIRERAALSAVRIILLTSDHRPGDSARSRELRIDAHLLKPLQQDELLETIYRVMSRAPGAAPTAVEEPAREPAAAPAAAPLHILLAEDDEFSAQLMERLLGRRGHRVRLATNGREALALAAAGVFDLLLLDVHMPELDGFEVAQAIRERERSVRGHLPVIALTARSRKEDRERCLAAGMDDFLTKPIRPAELLAAIGRLMPAEGVSRPAPQADVGEHVGLLDPVAVLTACGGDAEALRGMCRAFQTYLPVRHAGVGSDELRQRIGCLS